MIYLHKLLPLIISPLGLVVFLIITGICLRRWWIITLSCFVLLLSSLPITAQYDEFTQTLREFLDQRTREGVEHFYVMTKDDEVFSVGIRNTEFLQQSAKEGVEWLDGVRHMLQEYNPIDRHTIPITGDLFEG